MCLSTNDSYPFLTPSSKPKKPKVLDMALVTEKHTEDSETANLDSKKAWRSEPDARRRLGDGLGAWQRVPSVIEKVSPGNPD